MINYYYGDLFKYIDDSPCGDPMVICHIVNNLGFWGSGFVVPLGKKFPEARDYYHQWVNLHGTVGDMLGTAQLVKVDTKPLYVYNMCAQTGIMAHSTGDRSQVNSKPIRYEALVKCMRDLVTAKIPIQSHIICPKFGSDRAGGNWEFIEELIEEIWCPYFTVTVCVLEK